MCQCTDENEMSIWEKLLWCGLAIFCALALGGQILHYAAEQECYSQGFGQAILYNGESYCVGVRDGNTVLVRVN